MDKKDRQILALLQEDASLPVTEIAERVGLSRTPCWRRIQQLEEKGVIRKRVALLDRHKLDVPITVFVAVRTNQHNAEWTGRFRGMVHEIPQIVEVHRLSGDTDYLLRVLVRDINDFDAVYKQMIEMVDFSDVSSSFSMEEFKFTTAIPLG